MKADRKQQLILGGLIAFEIVLFSVTGRNFLSLANFFECIRLAVEIGLLSVALTPVIVTGGIDLSVGSLMGLCAVAFGAFWHDAQLSIAMAVLLTILVSLAGGAINALAIARLNVSPLIVTLGTYSLFRGVAEGYTAGAKSYTGFPQSFLYLGQGYLGGFVPTQTIVLAVAIGGFWVLLHRSTMGRALYAIGHSAIGTRYAAIPVARRLRLVYLLSGLSAGLAAIIYVAHLGYIESHTAADFSLKTGKVGDSQTLAYDQVSSLSQVKHGHSQKMWIIAHCAVSERGGQPVVVGAAVVAVVVIAVIVKTKGPYGL